MQQEETHKVEATRSLYCLMHKKHIAPMELCALLFLLQLTKNHGEHGVLAQSFTEFLCALC